MTTPRITIVGAGSIAFSMTLIRDIVTKPELDGCRISLMDINAERLEAVAALAERLRRELEVGVLVSAHTDRLSALDGARFVINTAALGERDLWPANREIARRHGYWTSKGFRISALRNTPLAVGLARDMERVCPDAWLLQYANPMVANVGAVTRYTKIKAVGLCHGFQGTVDTLAAWMNLDRTQLEAEAIGINHFIFITRWRYRDREAYPALAEWLQTGFPVIWETAEWQQRLDCAGPISRDLFHRLGLFPCNGDEHMTDYFSWYTSDPENRQRFRAKTRYLDVYLDRGNRTWQSILELLAHPELSVADAFRSKRKEAAADLIESLGGGVSRIFEVNIPNRCCLPSLPAASVVELPARVTRDGIQGLPVGDLPYPITAHVQRRLAEEELQMEAALQKDRRLLLQSLYLNPYTRTPEQAEAFLRDLAEIERAYVPWLH